MTNINIKYEDKYLMYAIDYIRINSDERAYNYKKTEQCIYFESDLIRNNNEWRKMGIGDFQKTSSLSSSALVRLYFPTHSVETYNDRIKYVLDLCIYINDTQIALGSFLIDRKDSLAAPKIIKYQGQEYYECVDLNIVDPWDLLYSEKFESFRKDLKVNGEDLNYDGTSLYASLHVVYNDGDKYLKDNLFNGGQNSINITDNISDYMNYSIYVEPYGDIKCSLSYNPSYKGNLLEYLKDTYYWETDNVKVKYILALDKLTSAIIESNNDELVDEYIFKYNLINSDPNPNDPKNTGFWCIVNEGGSYKPANLFSDWSLWQEGINIVSKLIFYTINEDGEEISKMILSSNKIPLTQELYSKLRIKEQLLEKIELDDMNNINIINSINAETISYSSPENSKSNIILPVFYRVRELGNIVIHPEVNENICINLDAYKSKVDTFVIQIEGVKFMELGTTGAGTIFNIIGSMLPSETKSGTYYIMSQNGDLVTTGKYIYEY